MKLTQKLFGITVMIIAAMTVLAGCGSTQQAGSSGGASAAYTTTDLVRALGGKATVDGDTVVLTGDTVALTGDVWVEKSLVVPEGVTLDLTASNLKLILKDGATLTVNGTVNANGGWGNNGHDGSLIIEDGNTVINGSGTINLKNKGNLLNIWGGGKGRKLTLDGVTLVGVKDNNEALVDVYEGGELVLKSGKITGNTRTNGDGGGVTVSKGGIFTMEGGTISGNSAKIDGGGGVCVSGDGATFAMKDGAITGNTASDDAGGVLVSSSGTFTMEGGTISGNTGQGGGGVGINAKNREGTTFTMSGGTISGNISGGGGGVRMMNGGTFIMEGGVISGNISRGGDGGVFVNNSTSMFTMKGGRIQGSTDSDGFTKNEGRTILNFANNGIAKWGTGGTYTKGGVRQTGGSNIASTDETLIAIPAR